MLRLGLALGALFVPSAEGPKGEVHAVENRSLIQEHEEHATQDERHPGKLALHFSLSPPKLSFRPGV